jgi:hypothetical protein
MKASRQIEGRRTAVRCISASCCIHLDPASSWAAAKRRHIRHDSTEKSWAAATASCIHHHSTPNNSVATLRMSCCSCGCSRSPDVSVRWGAVLRSSGDCAMALSSPETAWPGLKPIAEALFRANRRSLAVGVPNAGLVRAKTCRAPVCSHQTADAHPRCFRSYGLSSHYSADEERCGLLATACCAPFHLRPRMALAGCASSDSAHSARCLTPSPDSIHVPEQSELSVKVPLSRFVQQMVSDC